MENDIFTFEKENCTACYACVRKCPVKAIKVKKGETYPQVITERCIGCGSCVKACAFEAIKLTSSINKVKELLRSKNKIAAICDTSIASEFDDITDWRKFVKMLRILGFSYVCESAFGIDIIAHKQKRIVNVNSGKYYLTSHCPVMNLYVEKYASVLASNLTPTVSPASAMACVIRDIYGQETKIVNISPCLGAKKDICRHTNSAKIDVVLSFVELRQMFKEENIREESVEYSNFDMPLGGKGSLYPIPTGFIEAGGMSTSLLEGNFITAQGKKDSLDAVKQFSLYGSHFNRNFNLYFCEGCSSGPLCSKKGEKFVKHNLITQYVDKRLKELNNTLWESNLEKYSLLSDIEYHYKQDSQLLPTPSEEEMEEAYKLLGKENSGRHTDCHLCGYGTCAGLAEAIAQGIASEDMCLTHTQLGNLTFHNQLLATTKELLKSKENISILKGNIATQQNINTEQDRAFTFLIQNIKTGVAIIDAGMKIIRSNASFIDTLGDEAKEIDEIVPGLKGADITTLLPKNISSQIEFVLQDGENVLNKDVEFNSRLISLSILSLTPKKSVCLMIKNLYAAEDKPQEIINRVTEAIHENLRQVQEIGFILGEGASKTEKMLNTVIKLTKKE